MSMSRFGLGLYSLLFAIARVTKQSNSKMCSNGFKNLMEFKMIIKKSIVILSINLVLAACGGGGGSSGISSVASNANWNWANTSESAALDANSLKLPFVYSASNSKITNYGTLGNLSNNDIVNISINSQRMISTIQLNSSNGNLSLSTSDLVGSLSSKPFVQYSVKNNPLIVAYAVNPYSASYAYQFSSTWYKLNDLSTGEAGGFVAGSKTTTSGLSNLTSKNYTGVATGFYTDRFGEPYLLVADLTAQVNFATFLATISLSNTKRAPVTNPNLFSGFASIDATFTLPISRGPFNSGTSLDGSGRQLSIQFFGPIADEIGGTIVAPVGSDLWRYMYTFGGK